MTTPEARKKREEKLLRWRRWETYAVGLLMVVIGLDEINEEREQTAQERRDEAQTECLAEQVKGLTDALNARSKSTGSLNEATGEVLDAFVAAAAKVPKGALDTRTEAQQRKDSEPIIKALRHYAEVRDKVAKDRAQNPFPAFPTGKCDETLE